MAYLDTKEKRKGFAGTVGVHLLILVLFAMYGLKYPDPLPEIGIPINFGTSDVGSGEIQPDDPGEPTPSAAQAAPEAPSEEAVLTQDDLDALSTPPVEKTEDKKVEPKETPKETPKDTEPVKDPVPDPKLDADLEKRINSNPFAKQGGSEGNDDNKTGDKGQVDGTKTGTAYSGVNGPGGNGGTGNYNLGNRNAIAKIKPKYECDEYGTVIMQVVVNRQGITTEAKLKLKGTTNTASCLVNRAREAALKTKWQSDPSAPATQVGSITYHFELN